MISLLFRSALLALFLASTAQAARPNVDNLERSFAQARKEQVKSVHYSLHFFFTSGAEAYRGEEKISLELKNTKSPLSLDWLGHPPEKVEVNGLPISNLKVQTGSFEIPARYLTPQTEISVTFTNSFGKEGDGIQRVVDPEDNEEYIYTDFEPYQAHQLFPCFDQPDLKAHFDLTISAPKAWAALANELPEKEEVAGEVRTTKFRTTPLLSTYLFFVGAGPFQEWKEYEGTLPLYIYARKSLAKYVDEEKLFAVAQKGLRFFAGYFGITYPFSKFGMIFVPEFNWGGMENPGAITLNESNIFRGAPTLSKMEGRDSLILHEMAHMWFGDFVTMQWWNDLWLNESFATYLATIAQDQALGSPHAWLDFNSSKGWGYWQDQLITTHPIETQVADVRYARGNFDGITYSKGAAALQQLHFFVGEEAFADGLHNYFRKHAYGNATRSDFIGDIALAAKKDLSHWTRTWLQTSGLNRMQTKWTCKNKMLETLTMLQEPSSSGTLSPHRTRVGLFSRQTKENGQIDYPLIHSLEISYATRSTKVKFNKQVACPDFVYPNLDDKDYGLFAIDEKSMQNVEEILAGGSRDPLLRAMLWQNLYLLVTDAKLKPLRFLEIANHALEQEMDEKVLSVALQNYKRVYGEYLWPNERKVFTPAMEILLKKRIQAAPSGSTMRLTFFDFYIRHARTDSALAELKAMLTAAPEGVDLDQDRRWQILVSLTKGGVDTSELLKQEEARDASSTGKRMAYAARVSRPVKEAKAAFWKELLQPEKILPGTLGEASDNFHHPDHPELSEAFVKDFFTRLKSVDWKKSDQLVEIYFGELFPGGLCTKQLLAQSERELKSVKSKITPLARRAWAEANDSLSRCIRVRSTLLPRTN